MTFIRKPSIVFHHRPNSRGRADRIPPSERGRSRFEINRMNLGVLAAMDLKGNSGKWWIRMKLRALGAYQPARSGRIFVMSDDGRAA